MADRTLEEILAEAENPAYVRVTSARILLRQDLLALHEELDAELNAAVKLDASMNREPLAPILAKRVEELEAEMEEARVTFKFRALGRRKWADLLRKHPPTKDQLRQNDQVDHNPETFPIAALAASSHGPVMDEDAVRRLEARITDSQFTLLWVKCVEANVGGMESPKSLAAGVILRVSGASATTHVSEGFPEASSLDGS